MSWDGKRLMCHMDLASIIFYIQVSLNMLSYELTIPGELGTKTSFARKLEDENTDEVWPEYTPLQYLHNLQNEMEQTILID